MNDGGNGVVEARGVDVKGDGGIREEVNLSESNQAPKRRALRGRRRGQRERLKRRRTRVWPSQWAAGWSNFHLEQIKTNSTVGRKPLLDNRTLGLV